MRILIGKGTSKEIKSEIITDTNITYEKGLLLEFPVPAQKMKVSIIKDNNKKPALILLFDG